MKRSALLLVLSMLLGCAGTAGTAAPFNPRIGVQLWSVKDEIKQDFEGTLARLAALGFQGVEFAGEFGRYGDDPAALRAFLDKAGLRCASAHVGLAQLSGAGFGTTTRFYRTLGCNDLIVPWERRALSVEGSPQVAVELSALAARLAALGMRIGYHNHAEEMAGSVGNTPWDILARGTPAQVILQQDVGWTTFAGKDPVAYVRRYPGRSVSLHYKAKFAAGTSGTPIIGQDRTNWAGLTAAATSIGGTAWLIIEQEEYPDGMGQVEAVGASLRGLRAALAAH
ncbi:sugar phosphate isomerase/epimerase family protein [Massilia soli]|uniref:Sugar phosphate isomerase/epimerase n=1 Tax=Massilia soli TaxID=2792854 RepID=A0ABS7SIP8_9BURK|nr:sugar phosphate isomerase/epimerase [Massilia soli]MBZ2205700.1 sugar phosphate isomerase/epimerase [Massilia soli]